MSTNMVEGMLTLHAGLHKTGTTSIQSALDVARGNIQRRQIYLRWNDLFESDAAINVTKLHKIRDLSARRWNVVVSSEGALGSMSTAYKEAPRVVQELRTHLMGTPLRLVVYLRPQHDWVASAYSQFVKEGGLLAPEIYVEGLLSEPTLSHVNLVKGLSDAMGSDDLVLRPFSYRSDVVRDFFWSAGLGPVPKWFGEQRANSRNEGTLQRKDPAPTNEAPRTNEPSPLPLEYQRRLHTFFVADWRELESILVEMGCDEKDFARVLSESRSWSPAPVQNLSVQKATSESVTKATKSADVQQRISRLAFHVRHGPRHLALRLLSRTHRSRPL